MLVAAGAELQLQGSINLPAVEVSISGGGVSGSGALHSISGSNGLAGGLNLTNNLGIAVDSGSLTLSGPIQGSYNLTKMGAGTLSLACDNSQGFSGSMLVLSGASICATPAPWGWLAAGP